VSTWRMKSSYWERMGRWVMAVEGGGNGAPGTAGLEPRILFG